MKNKLLVAIASSMLSSFAMAGGFLGGEFVGMEVLMDALVLEQIHFDNNPMHLEVGGLLDDEVFVLVDEISEGAFIQLLNIVRNANKPLSVTQMMKLLEQIRLREFAQELLLYCHERLEAESLNADLRTQLEILTAYALEIHGEIQQAIYEEGGPSDANNSNAGWIQSASETFMGWFTRK